MSLPDRIGGTAFYGFGEVRVAVFALLTFTALLD